MAGFLIDPNTHSGVNPADINKRRKLAEAMLARSQGTRNITHPMQGVAQLVEAAMGGMALKRANAAENKARTAASSEFSDLMGAMMGAQGQPTSLTPATSTSTAGLGGGSILSGETQQTKKSAMDFATTMIGKGERPDNAALQDFMSTGGARLDPATKAWCAAYVNASLGHAGIDGTGKLNARSFMNWGQGVEDPQRGDVAVFSRGDPNGWQGHVGFFDSYNPDGSIKVLGGNQGDKVSLANYPSSRLLGFRRPGDPQQNIAAATGPQAPAPEAVASSVPAAPVITPTAGPAPAALPASSGVAAGQVPPRLMGMRAFEEDYQGPGSVPNSMRNVATQQADPKQALMQALTQPQGGPAPSGPTPISPPGVPSPAQRPAAQQSAGPDIGKMMSVLGNPYLTPSQRRMAEAVVLPRLKPKDPLTEQRRQLQIQKLRKDLNKKPERKTVKGADGFNYFRDTGERVLPDVKAPAAKPIEPKLHELFDEKTGLPYKARYNQETGTFDREGGVKSPSGTQFKVGPDGQISFQQGSGLKPLTEGQSKDTVFATRAEGALGTLDEHADALTSIGDKVGGNVPVVGNFLKSEAYQKAEQAGKEFLQAILRKDTGAAITAEETKEYGTVYLPQPGDTRQVQEQKKQSRHRALEAIKAGMPPNAILAQEKALNADPATAVINDAKAANNEAQKAIKSAAEAVGGDISKMSDDELIKFLETQ